MSDETKSEVKPEERPETKSKEPDMSWLPERLQREREKAIKDLATELGMPVDEAKTKLAELKKVEDAQKSETQRQAQLLAEKELQAKRLSELESVVKLRADAEMVSLTEEQRAAVKTLAGDDNAAQLKAIEVLRPSWAKPVAPAKPADEEAKATTAPPAGANSGPSGSVTSAGRTDHTAEYKRLKETNPFAAATYGLQRVEEVYKPKTS